VIRPATEKDLEAVYLMGYDAWGDGKPVAEYLAACRASKKYRAGTWYVLEEASRLLSSLIVYRLDDRDGETAFGIGSIATVPTERKNGHGTTLIVGLLAALDQTATTIYLHDELGGFYERFGFRALPQEFQRRATSVCMIRCSDERFKSLVSLPTFDPPEYF
jgi:predicted acetyltransferase